jgi:REP element-mobilizing transposase RayT
MARPLRLEFPGAVYHITSRGNEKNPIFLSNKDRTLFLNTLEKTIDKYKWVCHAYCLMDNHYHLLIDTPLPNLSSGMRQLNSVYTQAFNKRHKRIGHLYQGRFKAIVIDKESYLLEVARYVVLNPVRSKIVDHPSKWRWSSFRATTGIGQKPSFLYVDWILGRFGKDVSTAIEGYRNFVMEGIKKRSIIKKAKRGIILGCDNFLETLKEALKGKKEIDEIPRIQRLVDRVQLSKLLPKQSLTKKEERNKLIRKAVMEYEYTQAEVARYLGIHYSTVSKIVRDK